MSIENYRAWFDLVADDLDPDRRYPRPLLEVAEIDHSRFHVNENVVYIYLGDRSDAEIEYTIAHELRHWLQHFTGRLRDMRVLDMFGTVRYRARWHNHAVEYFARTQAQYELMPWELDANFYACDAMLRLNESRLMSDVTAA